jgi:hypothetical protein
MKFNLSLISFGVILVLLISSCSDPKSTLVPTDIEQWDEDKKFTEALEGLTKEEQELLTVFAFTAFGENGIEEGTTIGSAIDAQRLWAEEQAKEEIKQKALAAELKLKQLEKLKEMNSALTVTLVSLELRDESTSPLRYSDYFAVKIGLRNNSEKSLAGAKGVLVFKDMFDDELNKVRISYDDGISANESKIWSGTFNFNQFDGDEVKLATISTEKLQFEWLPTVLIFDDGSRIEMNN